MTFREITFSESKFLAGIPVLNTKYKHIKSQNNNPFYSFNNKFDNALAHYFAKFETTKRNINRFFTNLLIKPIIKKLLYCNIDK